MGHWQSPTLEPRIGERGRLSGLFKASLRHRLATKTLHQRELTLELQAPTGRNIQQRIEIKTNLLGRESLQ